MDSKQKQLVLSLLPSPFGHEKISFADSPKTDQLTYVVCDYSGNRRERNRNLFETRHKVHLNAVRSLASFSSASRKRKESSTGS